MTGLWSRSAATIAAATLVVVWVAPHAASARGPAAVNGMSASDGGGMAQRGCVPVRPRSEFYEAGRVASFPLTVPRSACTTISVSHVRDKADRSDRCQTFLVGFFPVDGSEATYTEPVTACSASPRTRTVLASNVPDGAVYRVLYQVDYIEPTVQVVRYKVWH
jgi:hypothetical protein